MVNILDVAPARRDAATPGVLHTANALEQAVNSAKARVAVQLKLITDRMKDNSDRLKYYSKVGIASPLPTAEQIKTNARDTVENYYKSQYGGLKGPCINALGYFDEWYKKAENANYPMMDTAFIKSFANFIMSVATDGFNDADTTGTWLQGRKGGLRGMGFKDE